MSAVIESLYLANCLLALFWAVRIWRLRLVRRYPVLFAYLVVATAFDLLGQWLYGSSLRIWGQKAYNLYWVLTTPLFWLLGLGVVLEVYTHMIENYAGVRKLGRIVLYGFLGGTVVTILALFYVDPYRIPDLNRWKSLWLKQEQGVYLTMAALVFALLMFKRIFGLSVPKNVQLIFATFGLYFAGFAALMVIRTFVGPDFRPIRDLLSMMLYAGCLVGGVLLFSTAGEKTNVGESLAGGRPSPEMAARAAQQLQSFNERLVRVLNA